MAITIRRSGPDDRSAVLTLMRASRGEGLTDAERAERGFVQGRMTEETLVRFEEGTGIYLAEDDGYRAEDDGLSPAGDGGSGLAGFAMTSPTPEGSALLPGPPGLTITAARAALAAAGRPDARLFLYGPAAVDPRFQGRGVLTSLLTHLCTELRDDFDAAAAFVEEANARSLAVHRHYGFTEVDGFTFEGRLYHVFTFDPAEFAGR